MAFAILRTKRITQINKTFAHNLRTEQKYVKHTDSSKTHLNEVLVDKLGFGTKCNFEQKIDEYIKEEKIKIRKDNNVKCLEVVLTASPDFFKDNEDKIDNWKKHQLEFLKKEFGNSLLHVVFHQDEKTPHLQAIFLADRKKIMKYRNQKGNFFKEVHQIAPGDYNPEYLRGLQDRYAAHNQPFGLVRGLKHSRATHRTLKEFYGAVERANASDYDKKIRKKVGEALKSSSKLGLLTVDKALEAIVPLMNSVLKDNKKLKTLLNYNAPKIAREANDLLDCYTELVKNNEIKSESLNSQLDEVKKTEESVYLKANQAIDDANAFVSDARKELKDLQSSYDKLKKRNELLENYYEVTKKQNILDKQQLKEPNYVRPKRKF